MGQPITTEIVTHRSGRTAADSGNNPANWGDAPSAFNMGGSTVLRVYPVITGTGVTYTIRVITRVGSDFFASGTTASGDDPTETIDFPQGFEGEPEIWIKLESVAGTNPNITFKLAGINK